MSTDVPGSGSNASLSRSPPERPRVALRQEPERRRKHDDRSSQFHPTEEEVQMKRLAVVTAALVLGVLSLAGPAGAAQPYMERVVQGPDTLAACSFPVLLQPTAPDVLNLFVFSDGEVFGAGPFVGTATNLDTGKTVKINLSGHFSVAQHSDGTVTVTSDGSVLSSRFGTIFSGHNVIQLDANGNVTSRTLDGTEEDLCAELAGP
jgi:hypothetical protein